MIEIRLEYFSTVNYALFHNGIPVVNKLELLNKGGSELQDVQVTLQGEYVTPCVCPVQAGLPVGKPVRLSSVELKLRPELLVELSERVVSHVRVTVSAHGSVVEEKDFELTLMPYDHWLGMTVLPQSLASFVTPNHPAVNSVIVQAAAHLKSLTGSSSFDEYQSGDPNAVRQQVAAIFAALHDAGLVYRALPASFEELGQRVSLPDQVLDGKLGNCLELTLLFASVLESVGINSVIVIQQGHAYLGVWLVDDCYTHCICDDAAYLEKKCSEGINEMMVLESTHIAQENSSFAAALQTASQQLARLNQFQMFIDVRRCRLERFLPLPARIQVDGRWSVSAGVEHGQCVLDVKEHDRYDLSNLEHASRELTKFDIWDRKLLDLSLRNSLLNMNLRSRSVQFMSFEVNRIEDNLQVGEEYGLLPKIDVPIDNDTDERLRRSKLLEPYHELISSDIEHHRLHTYLTEGETKTVLRNIYRAARNAVEETGANSLFLAIGALRWYEKPQSTTPRFAPLLLLPVEMLYKKGGYYIRTRDEDITLNITLIEFLRQVYDIRINGLDPLPTDQSGVDVPLIFAAIREALKEQKRWNVEEECILGTFSFSKFLMWNDVHNNREALLRNNIVESLVANKLTWQPGVMQADLRQYDATTSPTDLILPMSADSSQMAAILEAGKGSSFILYGPPGTGKSQTITNLIANALYQGKRVLFVAEKMAALSVVQKRLERIGLAPFCLELHSNKSTKRHVLEQLDKALKVSHIMPPNGYQQLADKIFEERKVLLEYLDSLHRVGPSDHLSLYDCLVHYEAIEAPLLTDFSFNAAFLQTIHEQGVEAVDELVGSRLEAVLKLVGEPCRHPLNGVQFEAADLTTSDKCVAQLTAAAQLLEACQQQRDSLALAPEVRQRILRDCSADILECDAEALRARWRAAKARWFLPRFFAKRRFMSDIRRYDSHRLDTEVDALLDDLCLYASQHRQIEQVRDVLLRYLDFPTEADHLPAAAILQQAADRLVEASHHADKMRDWYHWMQYRKELKDKGFQYVVDALEAEPCHVTTLHDSLLKTLYRRKAEEKMQTPLLSTFEGMLFDEHVKRYKQLSEEFQLLCQKELYARLAANVPRVTDGIDHSSEIGFLNRNISSGGRGVSMRDLFDQIPTLLPRLCPCMLMSPMSVAQYLNLSGEKIDLVVFDEASQMPTCEAVGAIARGRSVVVVGDPKQMPPTSFFSSTNVDEEEASIDDMESILEDCRTLEVPSLQLNWHYRSQHESLIAFSNHEYYDSQLITFPSADDQQAKVRFVPVKGFYDKGNKRTNRSEADAIVQEIVRRLRDDELRQHSIGVIAFSVVQQALIEDILLEQLDHDKQLREWADSMYEPIFVKNLENVQGDERDVILFSIGYGPDREGRVSMNFGPLNNSGGERRLNVAVSRARQEMMVYSTLRASQIDLRRTQAKGVEGLKHFLEYAENQSAPQNEQPAIVLTPETPSPSAQRNAIARQIAAALQRHGYCTTVCVGRSHFKVDVAVSEPRTPQVYRLGILLDGDGYRDTQTTRDREIVQPSVLESLRWTTMRVWSVDWFCNPERVVQRILEQLQQSPQPKVAPASVPVFDISGEAEVDYSVDHTYEEYSPSASELQKLSNTQLLSRIVAKEQPITFMHLCRRVCTLRELGRVTSKLQKELQPIIESRFFLQPDREGWVVWSHSDEPARYTQYRTSGGREIADIPMAEVRNAVVETLSEQVALQEEGLTLIVAKKLGFTRRGANVESAINLALGQLTQEGRIENADGRLKLTT